MPTIAGTDRVFINVRFADPNIWSDQDDRHDFLQTSYPPFSYAITTDPITGIRDGIMKRPETDPLVFQTDSGTELWQLRGSLNVEDGQGNPVPVPGNVRLYLNSSTSHGMQLTGFNTPAPGTNVLCQNHTPSAAIPETAHALLVAIDQWADQGMEPPPSNYPRLEDGTLVTVDEARAAFPAIPGVPFPIGQNPLELLDFGPLFGRLGGVLTLQPPALGPTYTQYVPRPDADGLDIAGVRPMQIRVSIGTNTGWNVRAAGHRAPNLCALTGSHIPLVSRGALPQSPRFRPGRSARCTRIGPRALPAPRRCRPAHSSCQGQRHSSAPWQSRTRRLRFGRSTGVDHAPDHLRRDLLCPRMQ
jgi:hypothetical protein